MGEQLRKRILTGSVLSALAVAGILLLPSSWILGSVMIVSGIAAWELTAVLDSKASRIKLSFYSLLGASLVPVFLNMYMTSVVAVYLLGIMWVFICSWVLLQVALKKEEHLSYNNFISLLILTSAIAYFPFLHSDTETGPALLLIVCIAVWSADISAYFGGKKFGRTLLAPHISPGKTLEGAFFGVVSSICFGLLAVLLFELSKYTLLHFAIIFFFTGICSILSDLLVSLLKRSTGTKDSGKILPGHGGVLDRIDSLLSAVPIFTILYLINYD